MLPEGRGAGQGDDRRPEVSGVLERKWNVPKTKLLFFKLASGFYGGGNFCLCTFGMAQTLWMFWIKASGLFYNMQRSVSTSANLPSPGQALGPYHPGSSSPVLFPRTSVVPCYLSLSALNSYDVDKSFVLRGELKSWEKMRSPRERGKKRPGHSSIQSGSIYQMSAVCGVLGLVWRYSGEQDGHHICPDRT